MILEIALGIVLAVLILAFLPAIIAFGAIAVGIILAIGALYLVWVFVSQKNWTQDDLAAISIFAAIAVAVVSLAKGAGWPLPICTQQSGHAGWLCGSAWLGIDRLT